MKPWMNHDSKSTMFKSNDPEQYNKSIYNHRDAFKDAKSKFQTKLQSQDNHKDINQLWQGSHATTGYKAKSVNIAGNYASLLNQFNALYAHFEQKVSGLMSSVWQPRVHLY